MHVRAPLVEAREVTGLIYASAKFEIDKIQQAVGGLNQTQCESRDDLKHRVQAAVKARLAVERAAGAGFAPLDLPTLPRAATRGRSGMHGPYPPSRPRQPGRRAHTAAREQFAGVGRRQPASPPVSG